MRKFFLLLTAALVLFVGFTVAVTARYESAPPPVQPAPEVAIPSGASERLAGSLVWVLPNTSGLNANHRPADFARAFRALRRAANILKSDSTTKKRVRPVRT